ncbi:MAG: phage tail assembly chaperone [Alphaproteobacteria bacterium]|nr:phage tail assembly chaperone [Alphaproteobacteria bacterium]
MTGGGLDWAGLMRAGLRDLRLHPDQFWSLTPAELGLMLGLEKAEARMTRQRLAQLEAEFADASAVPAERRLDEMEDYRNGDRKRGGSDAGPAG